MSETLMALGDYRFSINTAAYQELKHSQAYRWQSQERILRKPAMQFMGEGEESMSFTGIVYPHVQGGVKQIEAMREEAGKGKPLLLVDGLGFIWGQWVIMQINEGQSFFMTNGQPLKQTFECRILNYGEDN